MNPLGSTAPADSPHERFRLILLTVVSAAYGAAGYALDERPTQWAGGLFRFVKPFEAGTFAGMLGAIEYQHLYYVRSEYADGDFGRFRLTLARTGQPGQTLKADQQPVKRTLSALVVEDFHVGVLPEPDYWWSYENVTEMGAALAESGHLAVGYGMPWLSGDLTPP